MVIHILAAWALLIAQQSPLDEAWKLAADGNTDQAIQVAQRAVTANPRDVDARLLLGSLLMEKGERDESIHQLSEAVRLRPNSSEAQNALGEAYHSFGDSKSARRPFENSVALNPRFAQGHVNLGLVSLEGGELQSAGRHLDRAIALLSRKPDAAYAHYLRAKVYLAQSDTPKAAAQLESAVSLRPNMAEAWSDLGQARKLLLNEAGARDAFERAVKLDPTDAIAQYRLGAECLQQEKIDQAVEHLQAAYKLKPDDQSTLNSLQMALREQDKPEEAFKIKQELAALIRRKDQSSQNAVKAVALNNEGARLEKAGDLPAAAEQYRQALALNPEHNGIRVNYAVVLLRLGQWTDGLNQMHQALRRDPTNQTIQSALKDAMSQAPRDSIPKWDN
jgi:tetratricopeptide (TPR) repeat protein